MIYLLITIGGVGLLIIGLYLMTFGFGIPPSFGLFLLGLCLFVTGMLMIVLFAGSIDLQSLRIETTTTPKRKTTKKPTRTSRTPRPGIMEKLKTEIEPTKEREKPIKDKGQKTAKKSHPSIEETLKTEKEEETPSRPTKASTPIKPVKTQSKPTKAPTPIKPVKKPHPDTTEKPKTETKPEKEPSSEKTPKKPAKEPKAKDSDFVKERLQSLKRKYMRDVEGVDEVIEERLSPLKGVLSKMKSTIIWSFDALDVQDTMQDILTGAKESIVLMYPWIRNLDTSILKKCMDTKSKLIIQEASLDDDASVELIKLLIDNNVDVRTMPHVHTVAAVVDNKKGLIISTDPIYDSFEVGVIYNDKRSIKEIEKLFEKAWSLSKEISIGG
ncbi:MAG: hypothetical protein QFX38_03610 [Methanothermobacter sp.]|nr:hypothetical protein [Methanothermobacter sp.]